MLSQLRNSQFIKIFWGIMGLYLLNISVDTTDPYPEHITEDLTFNDQESIIEIFVEKVLGFEDAIKEYDDYDTKDYNRKKDVKVDLLLPFTGHIELPYDDPKQNKRCYAEYKFIVTRGYEKPDSPPPRI